MKRQIAIFIVSIGSSIYPDVAQAQWTFNPNLAPSLLYPVINNPCPNEDCGDRKAPKVLSPASLNPAQDPKLTYRSSATARRNNLAKFIKKIRTTDLASAIQIERVFSSTDAIGQIDKAMTAIGLKSNNVADAYAVYLTNAWLGTQGRNDDLPNAQIIAVRNQAAKILLAIPQFRSATNTQKQEMAEEMLIRAALISVSIDGAKSDPALMTQVKTAISQGAKKMGIDFDRMTLTPQGFQSVN
jgi:hypothetical protein